jgi:murein DD-endopeptidase MepM/ murein hydrolase activator NlpD
MAGARPNNDETEQLMKQLVKALEENKKKAQKTDIEFGRTSADVERLKQNITANRGRDTAHTFFRMNELQNKKEMLDKERLLFRGYIEKINADMNAGLAKSAEEYRREMAQYVPLKNYQSMQQAPVQQPRQNNNQANNATQSNTGSNAGRVASGAGRAAVGAVGLVGGGLKGIWGAAKGIKNSLASRDGPTKYRDPSDRSALNGLLFLVFFLIIVIVEVLGGGYFNSMSPVRWFYAFVFFAWGFLSFPEERNAVWMVFIYTVMMPIIFSIIGRTPIIGENLTSATIYHTIMLFAFPAILYYMLWSEAVRLPKWFGIMRFALVVSILVLGLGMTSATDVINRLERTGGDTGFSFPKAMDGMSGVFSGFSTGFLEPVVCALNPNCGFQNWLTSLTEPFAYDSTTVHEIQNRDLGIYVVNARIPREMDITGLNFQFLPEPIIFYINAPLPDRLAVEICQIGQKLKGFDDICGKDITVGCIVEDAGGTSILPQASITIQDALLTSNMLYQCRIANPRLGTKKVNLTVNYPFVTNTYKYIRAVNASEPFTTQRHNELSRMPPKTIISTGGPVILESDESTYISVRDTDAETNLIIRLRAQNNVRLTKVDNIELYLPSGMSISDKSEGLCSFKEIDAGETDAEKAYDECIIRATKDLEEALDETIADLESECGKYQVERDAVLACRLLDACEAIKEREAFEKNVIHDNAFRMTPLAIQGINIMLEMPSKQKTGNDILIACVLDIDADKFLMEDALKGITERALNIVSYYRAEHQVSGSVRFTGTQLPFGRVSYQDIGDRICNDKASGLSVPIGFLPIKSGLFTFEFGNTQDPLGRGNPSYIHRGIDMTSGRGSPIVAAWEGKVFRAVSNCGNCKTGYGNYVVIESSDLKGNLFYHIYAHLDSVTVSIGQDVRVGQQIGTEGNTGSSSGSHLHFEVRTGRYDGGRLVNPLACINYSALRGDRVEPALSVAKAGVTYTTPIVGQANYPSAESVDNFIEKLRSNGDEARAQFAERIRTHSGNLVDPVIMIAIAMQESSLNHYWEGRPGVKRNGDAIGLMQVRISTARTDCSLTTGKSDAEITRLLEDIDTNIKCGIEVFRRKPDTCPSTSTAIDCDCIISGLGIPLNSYDKTYKGKIRAYAGWSCITYPTYVNIILANMETIAGTEGANEIASSQPPARLV